MIPTCRIRRSVCLTAFCIILLGCVVDSSSAKKQHLFESSSKDDEQSNVRKRVKQSSSLSSMMLTTSSDNDNHIRTMNLNNNVNSMTQQQKALGNNAINANNQCNINFKDKNMALCYYEQGNKNFGDELGPVISKKLLTNHFNGCSANHIPMYNLNGADKDKFNNKRPTCLHSVGSIVHFFQSGDHMFGSGINPNRQQRIKNDGTNRFKVKPDIHIHSTRGPLTWQIIEEVQPAIITDIDRVLIIKNQVLNHDNMIYGDGGFLTVKLFPEFSQIRSIVSPNLPIQYCIIPHTNDLKLPEVKELFKSVTSALESKGNSKVIIISTHNDWDDQLRLIQTECNYVISSSLHGLIIADSMGIPTLWFQFENSKIVSTEGIFKYNDYYSGIGYKDMKPITKLNASIIMSSESYFGPIPKQIREQYSNAMIPAFPYDLFETLLI